MSVVIDLSALEEKFQTIKTESNTWLRVRRSISWIERAEDEMKRAKKDGVPPDQDTRFIFLWIAFNAAYGYETERKRDNVDERTSFSEYLKEVAELADERCLYQGMEKCLGPAHNLMDNEFVFQPFWDYWNNIEVCFDCGERFRCEEWEARFDRAFREFKEGYNRVLLHRNQPHKGECSNVLRLLFGRLYTLRNQLVHGGAAWKSKYSRDQVRDGTEIMEILVPIFVDVMMDNPNLDVWAKPFYPRVPESARRYPDSAT